MKISKKIKDKQKKFRNKKLRKNRIKIKIKDQRIKKSAKAEYSLLLIKLIIKIKRRNLTQVFKLADKIIF